MSKEKIERVKSQSALREVNTQKVDNPKVTSQVKSEGFLIRFLYNNYLDYNNLLYDNSNNN
ncbi:MAG TPA: hypothetical protein PLX15_02780 [Candidatus Woesearchaeota archaeon]|jgi:hypothetical protein|nr:hypothetical protein [Candidatus Woesearchaeota archaeon]